MISGPSLWWSSFYLTVNAVKYSIYQNSGPDCTYFIFIDNENRELACNETTEDYENKID